MTLELDAPVSIWPLAGDDVDTVDMYDVLATDSRPVLVPATAVLGGILVEYDRDAASPVKMRRMVMVRTPGYELGVV
jgi:hypothetical protein